MDSPVYRIATFCPAGISDQLSHYFGRPASNLADDSRAMRDVIALSILDPFRDSRLPFCCIFLGWASSESDPQALERMLASLNDLTGAENASQVTAEGFLNQVEDGTVAIAGAYPLLDLSGEFVHQEYGRVSLLRNSEVRHRLLDWSYRTFLRGALATDGLGIVIAVLAESNEVADRKIAEAIDLLQDGLAHPQDLGDVRQDSSPS